MKARMTSHVMIFPQAMQALQSLGKAAEQGGVPKATIGLADRPDPVPDGVWSEAARHHDERAIASLLLSISSVNVWNRLNVAIRQVAGEWVKSPEARKWVESTAATPANAPTGGDR